MDHKHLLVKMPLLLDKKNLDSSKVSCLFFKMKSIDSRLSKFQLANQLYNHCFIEKPAKIPNHYDKNTHSSQKIALDMNTIFNRVTNSIGIKKDYSKSKYTEITKFQNNDLRNYMQSSDSGIFISELRVSYRNDPTLTENKTIKITANEENIMKPSSKSLPKIQKTNKPTQKSCNLLKENNKKVQHFSPTHFKQKLYNDLLRNSNKAISRTELKPNMISADINQPENIFKRYEMYNYVSSKKKIFKP